MVEKLGISEGIVKRPPLRDDEQEVKLLILLAWVCSSYPISSRANPPSCEFTITDFTQNETEHKTVLREELATPVQCAERAQGHAENPDPTRIKKRTVTVRFQNNLIARFDQ
jgi:hypothetical protein